MIPRVLCSDPGKQKSRFGVGLLELHGKDIWIKAASQFEKKKYRIMEQYMAQIHKNNPVTHVVVEKNNVGIHVIESLKDEHHLPVFEITTANKVTDQKKILSARTMPKIEHAEWLKNKKNIEKILSSQYDLVCNGFETGGGSIRIHKAQMLRAVYNVMGYSEEETEKSVGHMLDAFEYGTPPHGGIALGVERNIMNLVGEEALREVQAFPMTRSGQTAVMDGPSEIAKEQLDELGIEIKKRK